MWNIEKRSFKKSSLQTQVWILVNSLSLSLALMIYGQRQPEADRKGVQRTQYRDLPPPTHRFGQYLRTIIMPSNNWYFSKYAYCTNNGNYSETLFAQKFCGRSSLISIIPEGWYYPGIDGHNAHTFFGVDTHTRAPTIRPTETRASRSHNK